MSEWLSSRRGAGFDKNFTKALCLGFFYLNFYSRDVCFMTILPAVIIWGYTVMLIGGLNAA